MIFGNDDAYFFFHVYHLDWEKTENGPNAGRVKSYNYKNTVIGDYQKSSYDITLPEGVDSVTVWLRYSAIKSTSAVGFNWLKLTEVK